MIRCQILGVGWGGMGLIVEPLLLSSCVLCPPSTLQSGKIAWLLQYLPVATVATVATVAITALQHVILRCQFPHSQFHPFSSVSITVILTTHPFPSPPPSLPPTANLTPLLYCFHVHRTPKRPERLSRKSLTSSKYQHTSK